MGDSSRRLASWGALLVFGFGWAIVVGQLLLTSYDTAVGVAMIHLVGGVGAVVTWGVARRTEASVIVRIMVLGWCVKVLGTLARLYVIQVTYAGNGDANQYSSVGAEVARMLRSGEVTWHRPGEGVVGTHFVEFATGVVFSVIGPTTLGGFVVFSTLSFVGTFLIYRAARIAAPEVDPRLYGFLLFLMPSMAFWPSSIGKEALMLLAIGSFTYGTARLSARRGGGLIPLGIGFALSAVIRPHITLLLVVALLLATVVSRAPNPGGEIPLGKIFKVALAATLLVWAASAAGSFLDVDRLDRDGLGQALQDTGERTEGGDSAFTNVNPVLYPLAVVTVLFRPFVFESTNLQGLIASMEGAVVLVLAFRRRHAIWWTLRQLRGSPLLAFAVVYTAVFVYAYTGINNFGILARQRVQVYPFVAMLLAVDTVRATAVRRSVPTGQASSTPIPARLTTTTAPATTVSHEA